MASRPFSKGVISQCLEFELMLTYATQAHDTKSFKDSAYESENAAN